MHECTRIHMSKYLFDSTLQGRIDCARSSLGATSNLSRILECSHKLRWAIERVAQFRISEEKQRKMYSQVNIYTPTPALIPVVKQKNIFANLYRKPFWRLKRISMNLSRFFNVKGVPTSSYCHYLNVCHITFRFIESIARAT